MKIIAGVDIGNSTTEVCIGKLKSDSQIDFLSSASGKTTGIKGTISNIHGIINVLKKALGMINMEFKDVSTICLNEATPVIGDTAMETLTETIITDSTMIGHDPSTPAGAGCVVGSLISLEKISQAIPKCPYIVLVPCSYNYEQVAAMINYLSDHLNIVGVILQADEAVLVYNRLKKKMPIVDEVKYIDKIPENQIAALEVAIPGQCIRMLSNPYGIATLLKLDAEQTQNITPIAKSLIGKRSAVVVKSVDGQIYENMLPAGEIYVEAEMSGKVSLDDGAKKIMDFLDSVGEIKSIKGQKDTNVGEMFGRIEHEMKGLGQEEFHIKDILAVDTMAPVEIKGALAEETCMEKAIAIAAMLKTSKFPMEKIAEKLESELGVSVVVAGVEAVMASLGALTTPGVKVPVAVLDIGGGSTDASVVDENGKIKTIHLAGAGELVSMLIQAELGLTDRYTAEQIKMYPLAKVESLFHLRLENGQTVFLEDGIDPKLFGHVVLMAEEGLIGIEENILMEKIVNVRREAKQKVFVVNAMRALKQVAPMNDLKKISNVVLVGGSAEDFEIPEMLLEKLVKYKIVCGRGNIRGCEGPRNAVATGLVMSYMKKGNGI